MNEWICNVIKINLKVSTTQENSMNRSVSINSTSKYIEVHLTKCGKYVAKIKNKYLGYFENEIDAAKARDEATKKYFGEFGKLNFPYMYYLFIFKNSMCFQRFTNLIFSFITMFI
jgi:hypothetical protein